MADEVRNGEVGTPIGISLPLTGGAGYVWMPEATPEVTVTAGGTRRDSGAIGGVVAMQFEVTLARAGAHEVVFRLQRPWEDEAVETRRIRFVAE